MSGRILSCQNLEIIAQNEIILNQLSLDIDLTEGNVIYGANNSGKTLLCESIFSNYEQIRGILKVCDFSLNPISAADKSNLRRKLGYLPQFGNLLLHKTVRVNLLLAINASDRIVDTPADTQIEELLKSFNCLHLLKNQVSFLSYSQQKIIGFLRAIIHKPKFIIIDDLSSHLDDDTVNSIITKLELLRSRENTSYVIFQHNLNRLAIHSAKSYEIVEKNIVNLNS